jgi:SAM-dependent methyltransferase
VAPELVPSDLERLYSTSYFEGGQTTGYPSYLKDHAIIAANFRDRLTWISALRPPGRRLLDVGAAYGIFVQAARESGWDAEGVEIAPDCAEQAARISGGRVTAGDFVSAPLSGRFDVIVMLDVLEHLRDPLACVKRAHELLTPGGLLVIESGNHASPWARLLGARWYFFDPPQHLYYFSRAGLTWLLARAGFTEPPRFASMGRRVSMTNVAFKLAKELPERYRERGLAAARTRLPGYLYLNFGDCMLVGARRNR